MKAGRSVRATLITGLWLGIAGCDDAKKDDSTHAAIETPTPAPDPGSDPAGSKAPTDPPEAQADDPLDAKASDPGLAEMANKTVADAKISPGEKLLAEAVEAVGGRERIDAIESFHSRGKVDIPGQHITATVEVWWKKGDFYMESDMAGVGKTRAWKKGEAIWSEDPISGKRKLEGQEARQTAWSASLSLVAEWKDHFDAAEVGETRTVDGKELVDVVLTGEDGLKVTLSLDAETHLPAEQSYAQSSPLGEVPIEVKFEDYREVAGLKIPHTTRTSMSVVDAVQTIDTWEANVEIDESRFSPE